MEDERGFGPDEEFEAENENENGSENEFASRRRPGFIQWVLTGFFVVVAGAAALSLILRPSYTEDLPEYIYEEDTADAQQPALTLDTPQEAEVEPPYTAAPETAQEQEPEQEQAPTVYVSTSLVAEGEVIGTLASREAAEELINEVLDHYLSLTEPDARMYFEPEITLQNAAPDAQIQGHDELLALFTGEKPPVDVVAEITVELTEAVPYRSNTKNDRYLMKGTSIVESMGKDGWQTVTTSRKYVNGELISAKDSEATVIREPVDALVRLGIQAVTNKTPDKKQGPKGPSTELTFLPPVEGDITSNYGQIKGVLHLGLDYEAKEGENVLASCAGTVVCVMERGGYGLVVEIDHGEGFLTRYAHLMSAAVKVGDEVGQGDVIGTVGMSGNADKAHLHFELRISGEAYNPRYYLSN